MKTTRAVLTSFVHVAVGATLIAIPAIFTSIFDDVSTDLDLSHYAERAGWARGFLPVWLLPLPANTFVNAGYVVVGLVWLLSLARMHENRQISSNLSYSFYVFCWMSIIYGQVQCVRIVTRLHWSAVLDQWYTLPIFAWVGVWSADLHQHLQCGHSLSTPWKATLMLASVSSYAFSLLHENGFEMALAVHIVGVIIAAWQVHMVAADVTYTQRSRAFFMALVCCTGFVVLKLADHELVAIWPSFFSVLSGHFWSKVADFLQIHYTFKFFANAIPRNSSKLS